MKIKFISVFLSTFISTITFAQSKLPKDFNEAFTRLKISAKYEATGFTKPSYLEADFNKDGVIDVAVLVVEKSTKKRGILIMHGGKNQYFILGAGIKFGNGGNDFKWLKGWSLYVKNTAYETTFNKDGDMTGSKKISLGKPALYVHDLEDGLPTSGGIIYWTGQKYIWIHQGE